MKMRRYRKSGIGPQPQKGQFSQLPSDVWVEVDSGKQIGNENEFPPDNAASAEKAIIDEVNMLRNDVSQRAASELVKIAKEIVARKLEVVKREVDEKNTATLRAMKKLRARSRGHITDSIEMAGYYAKKYGKTYFVYLGNSYGQGVWRVGEEGDALNPVNNQSDGAVFTVTPDLEITKLTIKR